MKTVLSLTMMLFCITAFAQRPYKVTTGKRITLPKKSYADNIISYGKDEACIVTSKRTGFMGIYAPNVGTTKFNLYNKSVFKKTVTLKSPLSDAKFWNSYSHNGKLAFQDALMNGSQIESYYRELDANGKVVKSTLINSFPDIKILLNNPEYFFRTTQSPNKKMLLSIAIYNDKEKSTGYYTCYDGSAQIVSRPNSIQVGVIDENGDLFFKKEIQLSVPADCGKISIEDYIIDNNGDVFLLIKQYKKGKQEKKGGETNYETHITAIINQGTDIKSFPVKTQDYFASRMSLIISNKGNVYCAGFLSESGGDDFAGLFTLQLEADRQSSSYKVSKFSKDDILKYNSKYKYKTEQLINGFSIGHIIENEDGITMFSEYFKTVTTNYSQGPYTTYRYGDIMIYDFGKDLALKNIYVASKHPTNLSPSTLFPMDYDVITHNDKPYLIFNDIRKSEENSIKDKEAPLSRKVIYVAMIVYYNGTSWVRERLFDKKELDYQTLSIRFVSQLDNDNIFLPLTNEGDYVLGKLTFTD